MPFLFVDYDQGAGGEYLSYILSQSPQCQPIDHFKTCTGRYKVSDTFAQEFLKPAPNPTIKESHPILYEIVPTHQHTALGASILNNVKSLRISNPTNDTMWAYLKQQQLNKVLLAREPTMAMFVGLVKILNQSATNPNFISEINHKMDNLSLMLVSEGIDPSEENRAAAIKDLAVIRSEPDYRYDLIVPYEQLLTDPTGVKSAVFQTFGIEVNINLLEAYKVDFDHAQNTPS